MMRRRATGEREAQREALIILLEEARSLAAFLLPGQKYQRDDYHRALRWEEKLRGEMGWLDQYSDAELGRRWRDRSGEEGEDG